MKTKIITALLVLTSLPCWAMDPEHRVNKITQKRQAEEFNEELDKIPLYRERLAGEYRIIGPIVATDALTKNRKFIIRQMRKKAYLMGANAISEYRCVDGTRGIYQQCEGLAIYIED